MTRKLAHEIIYCVFLCFFLFYAPTSELILQQFMQGLMQHHEEIVEYFNTRGVSAIFLFRRNLLRRMISVLANLYDRDNKLLNGTHKSHVHSPHEVCLSLLRMHAFYVNVNCLFLYDLTYRLITCSGCRQRYLQNTSL